MEAKLEGNFDKIGWITNIVTEELTLYWKDPALARFVSVHRCALDQFPLIGSMISANPNMNYDQQCISLRARAAWTHSWANKKIYKAVAVPLRDKIAYWSRITNLSLLWGAETLHIHEKHYEELMR